MKDGERVLRATAFLIAAVVLFSSLPMNASAESITWYTSYDDALQEAKNVEKPVLIYFYVNSSGPCIKMEEEVYTDPAVIENAGNFVCVKINTEIDDERADDLNISSEPTIGFLSPDEEELEREEGYIEAQGLIDLMDDVLTDFDDADDPLPKIQWRDYEDGRAEATKEDVPLMIYFREVNCSQCNKVENETLRQIQVVEYANFDFIPIWVNATERPELAIKHDIDVYPTILFLYPDGSHLGISEGYVSPPMLIGRIDKIKELYEGDDGGDDGGNDDSPGLHILGFFVILVFLIVIRDRYRR
ncbi:MAG: thioredoxin family protein [Thermoplasmata archaeon]